MLFTGEIVKKMADVAIYPILSLFLVLSDLVNLSYK